MPRPPVHQIRIDVTPLIGVLMALVVVMMITMPTSTVSTLINLPPAAPCFGCGSYDDLVTVSVDRQGRLHVNDSPSSLETLADDICAVGHKRECVDTRIYLDGSPDAAYGDFAEVVDRLRGDGFHTMALINKDFAQP